MKENDLENAVLIAEKEFNSFDNFQTSNSDTFHFLISTKNHYRIYAHPGPEVATTGRAEHLPYHIHIKYSKGGELARVDLETLKVMGNGRRIPKELKSFLEENQGELLEKTKDIYHTGKLKELYD